jgi:hypothetical protein
MRRGIVGGRRVEQDRSGERNPPRDRVPDAVVDRAKAAFRSRVPGELAVLVSDSVDAPAGVQRRVIRFECAAASIEAVVAREGDHYTVQGRVEPGAAQAELDIEGNDIAIIQDASSGVFCFPHVPDALVRVRFTGGPGAAPVHTAWFRP